MPRLQTLAKSLLLALALACANTESAPTAPDPALARAPAPTVTVTQLPSLGGITEAFAVNDAGTVVGSSQDGTSSSGYAVRWTKGSGGWSISIIGGLISSAQSINSQGTAVGWWDGKVTVWRPSEPAITLGSGQAHAINDAGFIAGFSHAPPLAGPTVWTPSGAGWIAQRLPTLLDTPATGCGPGDTRAISASGVIVGFGYDASCTQVAVQWRPLPDGTWARAERLAPPGSTSTDIAYGISGTIAVGAAWPCAVQSECARRAYQWSVANGTSGPVGSQDARANGVNSSAIAVGSYVIRDKMMASAWTLGTSTVQTLPTLNGSGKYWAWGINNPILARPETYIVGGTTGGSGGKNAIVWTMP